MAHAALLRSEPREGPWEGPWEGPRAASKGPRVARHAHGVLLALHAPPPARTLPLPAARLCPWAGRCWFRCQKWRRRSGPRTNTVSSEGLRGSRSCGEWSDCFTSMKCRWSSRSSINIPLAPARGAGGRGCRKMPKPSPTRIGPCCQGLIAQLRNAVRAPRISGGGIPAWQPCLGLVLLRIKLMKQALQRPGSGP